MILKGNCWVSYFLTHRLRDGYSFTYHLKCYLEENTFFPPFGSVIFKWLRQIGYPGMGFIVKKETALTQKVPILQQRSSFASHFPWPSSFVLTYSSVRKLVKLSAVQFMLNNHTVSGWAPFLVLLSSHLPAHILSAVDMVGRRGKGIPSRKCVGYKVPVGTPKSWGTSHVEMLARVMHAMGFTSCRLPRNTRQLVDRYHHAAQFMKASQKLSE